MDCRSISSLCFEIAVHRRQFSPQLALAIMAKEYRQCPGRRIKEEGRGIGQCRLGRLEAILDFHLLLDTPGHTRTVEIWKQNTAITEGKFLRDIFVFQ